MKENDWYNKPYIDKKTLLLEKYINLDLTDKELVLSLIIIDMLKENVLVSSDNIRKRCKYSISEINEILHTLDKKKYLLIKVKGNNITVDLSGLFNEEDIESEDYGSLISVFEQEFGRTLSHAEVNMIGAMIEKYKKDDIVYALRQAILNNAKSTNYVAKILVNIGNDEKSTSK